MKILDNGYVFVERPDWDPQVDYPSAQVRRPADEVYLHHSVTTPTSDPCADARRLEAILDARNLDGYNYLIHPTGVVIEFAGERRGEHTYGTNSDSYGFCFIGNYQFQQVTLAAIVACSRTVNLMRLKGDLVPELNNLQILHHRDVRGTLCPGDNNQNINGKPLKDWVRWFAGTAA